MPPDAPTQAPPRRREMTMWLIGLVAVAALIIITVVAMGGRVESATWGLVVAASSMVFALHSMYRMATVLSRPAVEVVLEQDDVAALAGVRELREEKRRVLRAINELQFDYEMGKLSEEDYKQVRQGYQLRAVEVMRALDERPSLHPDLQALLEERGLAPEAGEAPRPDSDDDAESEESEASGADAEGDAEESEAEQAEANSEEPKAESSESKTEAKAEEPESELKSDEAESKTDEAESSEAKADDLDSEARAESSESEEAKADEPSEDAEDEPEASGSDADADDEDSESKTAAADERAEEDEDA